jgi:hypothetical protein
VKIAYFSNRGLWKFYKIKREKRNKTSKFSLILWKYHTNFSSQFLQVNGILKFAPQYKLIKNYAKSLNFYDITFSYKFPLSLLKDQFLNLAKR